MKVDFRKLEIKDLEGNVVTFDASKQLANFIYMETQDLGDLILAQDIYKNGEVELNNDQINKIKGWLRTNFKAFVQKAFEDYINNNKDITDGAN